MDNVLVKNLVFAIWLACIEVALMYLHRRNIKINLIKLVIQPLPLQGVEYLGYRMIWM